MASSSATAVQALPLETEKLAAEVSGLEIKDGAKEPQEQVPPHRSHDPQYNQKRSDPFQFGSRYLNQDDDVFEFNAWDHVETDDVFKEYAEKQYAMQRESPVSDFDKRELHTDPFHCRCSSFLPHWQPA
jgi:tRNAThr (cytosine32-N3)-methyltransferase